MCCSNILIFNYVVCLAVSAVNSNVRHKGQKNAELCVYLVEESMIVTFGTAKVSIVVDKKKKRCDILLISPWIEAFRWNHFNDTNSKWKYGQMVEPFEILPENSMLTWFFVSRCSRNQFQGRLSSYIKTFKYLASISIDTQKKYTHKKKTI